MTIISKYDIRKGDRLKVTYFENGLDCQVIGVAHRQGLGEDWTVEGSGWLTNEYRTDEKIELLERPKTAEELRKERRDKLAYQFSGDVWNYDGVSRSTRQAIDHIIFLEDVKEAVAN